MFYKINVYNWLLIHSKPLPPLISRANNHPGGGRIGQSCEVSTKVTCQSSSTRVACPIRGGGSYFQTLSLWKLTYYNFKCTVSHCIT